MYLVAQPLNTDQYISTASARSCFPAMPAHTSMSATPFAAMTRTWGSAERRDPRDQETSSYDEDSREPRGAPCGQVTHLAAEDR